MAKGFFSYASSYTLYSCESVSQSVGRWAEFGTSVAWSLFNIKKCTLQFGRIHFEVWDKHWFGSPRIFTRIRLSQPPFLNSRNTLFNFNKYIWQLGQIYFGSMGETLDWEPEDIHTDPSLSTTFPQFKHPQKIPESTNTLYNWKWSQRIFTRICLSLPHLLLFRNTFFNINKYTLQFGQIYCAIWKNTFCYWDKYILQFGHIHLVTWEYPTDFPQPLKIQVEILST